MLWVILILFITLAVAWVVLRRHLVFRERCPALLNLTKGYHARCRFFTGHVGPHYARWPEEFAVPHNEEYWENESIDPEVVYFNHKLNTAKMNKTNRAN
jgi:hypothetical protein